MFRPKTSIDGRLENSSEQRTAPPSGGSNHPCYICKNGRTMY